MGPDPEDPVGSRGRAFDFFSGNSVLLALGRTNEIRRLTPESEPVSEARQLCQVCHTYVVRVDLYYGDMCINIAVTIVTSIGVSA